MSVHISFRNLDSTEALKNHVETRVERITRLLNYPVEIHVILEVNKLIQNVEVTCHAEHKPLVATGSSENMYESVDLAVSRLETQLKKERDYKKGHKSAHQVARTSSKKLAQDVEAEIPHRDKKAVS